MIKYQSGGIGMQYYDKTFKMEALQLSDEIGTKKAAEQLGISYFTLSNWRKWIYTKKVDTNKAIRL